MEKVLKNLNIGKKLLVAFGIVIGCSIIITIVVFISLSNIGSSMEYFYSTPYRNNVAQLQMRRDVQSLMKNILRAASAKDAQEAAAILKEVENDSASQSEQFEFLKKNFADTDLISKVTSSLEIARSTRGKMMDAINQNNSELALKLFEEEYFPAVTVVINLLKDVGVKAEQNATNSYNDVNSMKNTSYLAIISVVVISLILSVYLCVVITRVLKRPIVELEAATRSLSEGQLDINIEYESKDELGLLATNFNKTCEGLKVMISDLSYILAELANGSFNVRTRQEKAYVGLFNPLLVKLREMIIQVSGALLQINNTSSQVALGSTQMADSAQSLAEGATEQAGAVEELQATITDVLGKVEKNARDSKESAVKAIEVKREAQNSSTEMKDMTEAMRKINDTSTQIVNIISEIEDIASQTNLLSVNAAIEAARAGEAGKGFAVVAQQIGKLAEDSATSAVNTRRLIESSIQEVENGGQITERTAASLDKVIHGIQTITERAEESNAASEQQAEAMQQIEQGINQISSVVQTNSAAAEETSATSEELSAQAETLRELVGKFKLRI